MVTKGHKLTHTQTQHTKGPSRDDFFGKALAYIFSIKFFTHAATEKKDDWNRGVDTDRRKKAEKNDINAVQWRQGVRLFLSSARRETQSKCLFLCWRHKFTYKVFWQHNVDSGPVPGIFRSPWNRSAAETILRISDVPLICVNGDTSSTPSLLMLATDRVAHHPSIHCVGVGGCLRFRDDVRNIS